MQTKNAKAAQLCTTSYVLRPALVAAIGNSESGCRTVKLGIAELTPDPLSVRIVRPWLSTAEQTALCPISRHLLSDVL